MNSLLVQGFRLAKAGDRNQAYDAFSQVVKLDPSNEYGWLWRAQTTDDLAEAYVCLQRVLSINPNNDKAQRGIERIKNRVAGENVDLSGGAFDAAGSGFTGRVAPENDFSANPRAAQQTYNDTGQDVPFDPNNFVPSGTNQARGNNTPPTYGYQEPAYTPGPTSGGYGAQPGPAYGEYDEAAQGQDYDGAYLVPVEAEEERQQQRAPRQQPQRRRGGFPLIAVIAIALLLLLLLIFVLPNLFGNNNQANDPNSTPTINAASATVPLVSDADQTSTASALSTSGTNPGLSQTIAAGTAAVIATQNAIQTSVAGGGSNTIGAPATTAAATTTVPPASTGAQPTTIAPIAPTQAPATNPPANINTENADKRPAAYAVQRGNSLSGIATNYKTTPDAIVAANKGRLAPGVGSAIVTLPNNLYFNTILIIPVNRGDFRGQGVLLGENGVNSVQDVANKYNKSVDDIVRFNGLKDANDAKAGDALLIP